MTQSLLNSWLYQFSDFEKYVHDSSEKTAEDYQQSAFEEFLSTLRRERREPSAAMQKGIDFEELVIRICHGKPFMHEVPDGKVLASTDALNGEHTYRIEYDNPQWAKWHMAAKEVANDVKGGQFQVVAQKKVNISGIDFLLYGRLDCLQAGVVKDIKFTGKYEVGKFYNNPQHPMYMELVPEASRFDYLASNGSRVWRESYRRDECRPIKDIIQEFVSYLRSNGLISLYQEHWKTKGG